MRDEAFPRSAGSAGGTHNDGMTYRQWLIGMMTLGAHANPNRDCSGKPWVDTLVARADLIIKAERGD